MLALFRKYLVVFLVSMVPIVELRGAIPIGVGMGLPLAGTYAFAILGNMLPVPVIILFSKQVLLWCCKLPGRWGKPFNWIYRKGLRAGDTLQKKTGKGLYFALFLFVAIPLPGTGAWTGSLGATLLDMKFWPSVLAVMCGVLTAGLIMGAVSAGIFGGLGLLFA